VAEWQDMLQPVTQLRNADLKERHWAKLEEILGVPVHDNPEFTLGSLFDLDVRFHFIGHLNPIAKPIA
jgi:Dynein heavy chain, N-terminal region 2